MSTSTFIRLGGGIALAVSMYVLLPMLDVLNITFVVLIGLVWFLIVVDIVLLSAGAIGELSQGISGRAADALVTARNRTATLREELRSRVEARLDANNEAEAD